MGLVVKLKEMWHEWRKEEIKFPCVECIVFANCTEICDKVEHDEFKIRDFIREYKCCPDCGAEEFYEGPQGGISTNVMCGRCGHKFNFSPFSVERIGIGARLVSEDRIRRKSKSN